MLIKVHTIKDRFYYWTCIQVLLRAVFYGVSALDRNTNMMIGIVVLGAMEYVHGICFPFKINAKNHLELSLLFNLQFLFVISLYIHYVKFYCSKCTSWFAIGFSAICNIYPSQTDVAQ